MNLETDQQLLAEQLRRYQAQAQTQAPQGRMVGNVYARPHALEYIAAGLRGYGGMKGQETTAQQMRDLQTQKTNLERGEMEAIAGALRGTPAKPAFDVPANEMGEGFQMNPVPAQPGSAEAMYARALQSPMADFRKMGMQGMIQMPELKARQEEAAANRTFRAEEAAAARKAKEEAAVLANQQRQDQMTMAHQLRMDQMAAQNASREQMAQEQRAFQQQQAEAARAFQKEMKSMGGSMASQQPYFQPVQTAQGVFAFNARTGRVEPVTGPGGAPIVGAAADPTLQGRIAGAKTGAQTEAKMATEARIEAPKAIAQAEEAIKLVDDLLVAPGFKQAVGGSRLVGIQKIPGTAAKDFDIRLDQLKGKQFLQAFESLKGGGAITEVEGKKATDAIARMDAAGSEAEFTKAAREFQSVIRSGMERAKKAQGGAPSATPNAAPKRIKLDAQGNIVP